MAGFNGGDAANSMVFQGYQRFDARQNDVPRFHFQPAVMRRESDLAFLKDAAETNWKQVKATKYQVAVLPMGATEAHNWHLPYGTDSYQNEALCAEAARIAWEKGAKVGILPNIPFGVQTGQLDIPFCINMNPS